MKVFSFKPVLICICTLVLLYTLLGFLVVPRVAEKVAGSSIESALDCRFDVDSIFFNPFTLEARMSNLALTLRDGSPFFSLGEGRVNLSVESLFKMAPVITACNLSSPRVHLTLRPDGTLVIPGILKDGGKNSKEESAPGKVFEFRLSGAVIKDGAVTLSDLKRGVTHQINGLNLAVPRISTLEDERRESMAADADFELDTSSVSVKVQGLPFVSRPSLVIRTTGDQLNLNPCLPYVTLPKNLTIASPGSLSWDLTFDYQGGTQNERQAFGVKGKFALSGFRAGLSDRAQGLGIPGIEVSIDSPDILKNGIHLGEIRLTDPGLDLFRKTDGSFPVVSLAGEKGDTQGDEPMALPAIAVDRIVVDKGRVTFEDRAVPEGFHTELFPVSVRVEHLNVSRDGLSLNCNAEVITPAKERITLSGEARSSDQGMQFTGNLSLENGSPEAWGAYLKPYDAITAEGVNAATDFSLTLGGQKSSVSLSNAGLGITDLQVQDPSVRTPALNVEAVSVKGAWLDLDRHVIRAEQILLSKGRADVRIDKEGRVNLISILGGMAAAGADPEEKTQESADTVPWQAAVGNLTLNGWDVRVSDAKRSGAAFSLSDIFLSAEGLSTLEGSKKALIKGHMAFEKTGRIDIDGTLDPPGLATRLNLDLQGIDIRPFEPYINDYANLGITGGRFQAKGAIAVSMKPSASPKIRYTGGAGLTGFDSVDKASQTRLVQLGSVFLNGMDIGIDPVKIDIGEVNLTDLDTRAVILSSGKSNFAGLGGQTEPSSARKDPEAAMPDLNIRSITLKGGHVSFTDLFTQPNYVADITELSGRVSDLSSHGNSPARITLKGVHGRYSPLDITGQIGPLAGKRSAGVNLSFKNIGLAQFNTYSRRYLGYGIQRGKLRLDLSYTLEDNTLNSSNQLFFDQLTLGDKSLNPAAAQLPLPLAVSLLTNEKGQIDLDVPIRGNLDDPKFSFGGVAATAFKNLILGVVAAPFKFLGKLIGNWDSGELGFVAFAPGLDQSDPIQREKLDELARILSLKNAISLKIKSVFEPKLDGQALRMQKFRARLLGAAGTEDESVLKDPDQHRKLVKSLWDGADFAKPRDEQGKEKELDIPGMERLLIDHIRVEEAELRALARRRSKNIKAYITSSGTVGPDRLIIQQGGPAKAEDTSQGEVKTRFSIE